MKRTWQILPLSVLLFGASCKPAASTDPNSYVGEYVFQPYNVDPGKFADLVILKADFSAVEIRFSKDTGQVTTNQTKWALSYRDEEFVEIGNFAHPVEGAPPAIKLGINGDLGQYYEKVR